MRNAECGMRNGRARSGAGPRALSPHVHSAFRIPHSAFDSRRPPDGERHVVPAEPEGVRERDVHVPLHGLVRGRVEVTGRIGGELVMVGGMTPVWTTRAQTPASKAPAAPSRWPVIDLVDPKTSFRARSPNTAFTAAVSAASPCGVDVP